MGGFDLDAEDFLEIARIALPTLAAYAATQAVLMSLSAVWARLGVDALAAYGLATLRSTADRAKTIGRSSP